MNFNPHLCTIIFRHSHVIRLDKAILQVDSLTNSLQVARLNHFVQEHVVYLFLVILRVCQFLGQIAIIREKQHSRGLAVKSSNRVHALFTSSLDQGHHGSTFQRIFHGRHVIFRLIQHQVYFTLGSNHLIIYLHSIRTFYFYPDLLHDFPVYFHPTGCNQHICITT